MKAKRPLTLPDDADDIWADWEDGMIFLLERTATSIAASRGSLNSAGGTMVEKKDIKAAVKELRRRLRIK